MASVPTGSLDIGHPAPERHKLHPAVLLFTLFGAPAAWMAQLLFGFASTSYFCVASNGASVPAPASLFIFALNLVGLAIALASLLTARMLLDRTVHEHKGRSGGVMDAGEGRTRFLAVWGIFISVVFFVATLANTFSLVLVPLCRR